MWRIGEFFKKFCKKAAAFMDCIPRKIQVCVNLLLILALLFGLYIFQGSPSFSVTHAYRRAEKANLVGPGRILGVETINFANSDTCVVADTDDGVILCVMNSQSWGNRLVYRNKMGKVSVYGVPLYDSRREDNTYALFVLDEYPEAVKAELDLELRYTEAGSLIEYTKAYTLTANRKRAEYFRFDIAYENDSLLNDSTDKKLIRQFGWWSWELPTYFEEPLPPATVRLYDHADHLICTCTVELFPEASR